MIGDQTAGPATFRVNTPGAIRPRWQPDWLLVAICALAAIPSLYLAFTQFMEYDGFWHVFIAQQDNWRNFWFDWKANDHPPLFYLLLKLMLHLGRSAPIYRSISIASDLGSIYLTGLIARKLSTSRFTPPLAALAFGLSIAAIEISVSVRSYMLAIFFVLLSFYYFLDLLPGAAPGKRARSRILFSVALLLAVSSHYFTVFYVAACGVVLAGIAALAWSSLPWKTWAAHALAFLPVAWLMRYYYRTHIRLHSVNGDYLETYSFKGNESKAAFLVRNLQSAFNFLSPVPITNRVHFVVLMVVLLCTGLAIILLIRSRAAVPLLMLAVLTGELAWAGLHGKYPFGGLLRQQFILFPFAVLSAGVYFDRLLALLRGRGAPRILAATAAVALLAVSAYRFEVFPKIRGELFTREMTRFDAAMPEARAVLLDQFNLIVYFTHHHQWKWIFSRRLPIGEPMDEYRLVRGNRRLAVIRDRMRWNFEFSDPDFIRDLAASLHASGLDSLAVFCIHQFPGSRTPEQQDAFQQKVFALAAEQHLQIRKFVPDGLNVYAEFALDSPQVARSH